MRSETGVRSVRTALTGVESLVRVKTLTDASCLLFPENQDAHDGVRLVSDEAGIVRFSVEPAQEGTTRLSLRCRTNEGGEELQVVELRGSARASEANLGLELEPPTVGRHLRALSSEEANRFSQDELVLAGYPPRPDRQRNPSAHSRWLDTVSVPHTLIEPHVVERVDEVVRHDSISNINWSGIITQSPSGSSGPYTMVEGAWTIPTTIAPSASNAGVRSSMWVGFDLNDVLQGGSDQNVVKVLNMTIRSYYMWFELLPYNQQTISNFPVKGGQNVYVQCWPGESHRITSPNGGYGYCYYVNNTTHVSTTFGRQRAAGSQFLGQTIEWVVERPLVDGSPSKLANYGTARFTLADGFTYNDGVFRSPWTDRVTNVTMMNGSHVLSTVSLDQAQQDIVFTWHASE